LIIYVSISVAPPTISLCPKLHFAHVFTFIVDKQMISGWNIVDAEKSFRFLCPVWVSLSGLG